MEFNGIVGHIRPKSLLSSIFEKNRFPHALLFSGPPGVGKYTMAVEVVKHLFCEKGTACGVCRTCQNVIRNTHPDFRVLRAETTIGIDELRTIRKEVYEPPYEAPFRAIVIDGAEEMTREAANALLKTLEEPPPRNLFFLITSSEKDLPLTIRSRCMHIGFGPISEKEMKSHLINSLGLAEGQAELLASLGWGSMSSALFWMNEENLALRRRLAELVIGERKGFVTAAGLAEMVTSYEKDAFFFLYFLLSLFRDLWVVSETREAHIGRQEIRDNSTQPSTEKSTDNSTQNLINKDLKELLEQATREKPWIERSIHKVQEAMESLRYNVNRWLTFEYLALSLMRQQ